MTREEKTKKIVNKCRGTSHCGNCKLYGYYSVCPVYLYLKDGTPMVDWSINRAYEILFEEEMKNIEQEKKEMTVEELVKVIDKSKCVFVREFHTMHDVFSFKNYDKKTWDMVKQKNILQVTPITEGILIFVAPPTEK